MTLNEAKQSTHNILWLMMMMVTLQLTVTYDTKFGYKRFSGSEAVSYTHLTLPTKVNV